MREREESREIPQPNSGKKEKEYCAVKTEMSTIRIGGKSVDSIMLYVLGHMSWE
jgi:hypothetical protein